MEIIILLLILVPTLLIVGYVIQEKHLLKSLEKETEKTDTTFLDITIPFSEDRPARYTDQLLQGLHTLGPFPYILCIHSSKGSPASIRLGGPTPLKNKIEAIIRATYPMSSLVEMKYRFPLEYNWVCFLPQDAYLPLKDYSYDKNSFPTDPLSQTITLLSEHVLEEEGGDIEIFILAKPIQESEWKNKLVKDYIIPLLRKEGIEGMNLNPTIGNINNLWKKVKKKTKIWKKISPQQIHQTTTQKSIMTEEEKDLRKRLERKHKQKGFLISIFLVSTNCPPPTLESLGMSIVEQYGDFHINTFIPYRTRGKKRKQIQKALESFTLNPIIFFSPFNLRGRGPVVSTSELATIWHVADKHVEDPNVSKGTVKELPPPIDLPILNTEIV